MFLFSSSDMIKEIPLGGFKESMIEVYYLYHSGFAVRMNNKLMIFDYYNDKATNDGADLANGIFEPSAHKNEDVFIFSSHKHSDHYNPVILDWKKQIPGIHYILSQDINVRGDNVMLVQPEKSYILAGMEIQTLASTDEGVAFLIHLDGVILYHAGDLHWWHWDGEPDPWNPDMEKQYKKQIAKLKDTHIDVAFLPVDPRQEYFSTLGIEWFLREISCSHVFPMHFGQDYSVMETLCSLPQFNEHLPKLHLIAQRGQSFVL